MIETYGIKRSRIGGLNVRIGGKQWVPGSGRFYLSSNLSHATQCLVVRPEGHRVERKGFPMQSLTVHSKEQPGLTHDRLLHDTPNEQWHPSRNIHHRRGK